MKVWRAGQVCVSKSADLLAAPFAIVSGFYINYILHYQRWDCDPVRAVKGGPQRPSDPLSYSLSALLCRRCVCGLVTALFNTIRGEHGAGCVWLLIIRSDGESSHARWVGWRLSQPFGSHDVSHSLSLQLVWTLMDSWEPWQLFCCDVRPERERGREREGGCIIHKWEKGCCFFAAEWREETGY